MKRDELLKLLEKHKSELHSLGVRKLGIFGSYARGDETSQSDVDVLVRFSKIQFDSYMSVYYLLQKITGKRIDLVIESDLKPELKYVLREAIYVKI